MTTKPLSILLLLGTLALWPFGAQAHCDAVNGPVANAALKALGTKNVNLVLPYAPPAAESELTAAFAQAAAVRPQGAQAKALAERYFMETAVRLHRAGENAPYTGLKSAGTDFGPAIPAAEQALASGHVESLQKWLAQTINETLAEHFQHARAAQAATKEPATPAEVAVARERVRAELAFIGYVEDIYRAIQGAGHAEDHTD